MPIQAISIGPATSILQNVVYALPAKPVLIGSVAAVEISIDGSTWVPYTAGTPAVAKFIRCTTGNTTVMCLAYTGSSSSGGDGLTNPIIEQEDVLLTLISQTLAIAAFANLGLHVDDEAHGLDIWFNNALRSIGGGPLSANYSNTDGPHVFFAQGTEILKMAFNGVSVGVNPAQSGILRIPYNQAIKARNSTNTADVELIRLDTVSSEVYIGEAGVKIPGTLTAIGGLNISGNGVVNASLLISATGHMTLTERLTPPTPSSPNPNQMYVWCEDNGAGKTRLMCKFNTGAAIQIAIEP